VDLSPVLNSERERERKKKERLEKEKFALPHFFPELMEK